MADSGVTSSKPEAAWRAVLARDPFDAAALHGLGRVLFRRKRPAEAVALLSACRAGLGIAVMPHFLGRGDPQLELHADHAQVLSRPLWLAVHPDVRRSPRVTAVAELLAAVLQEHAALLA